MPLAGLAPDRTLVLDGVAGERVRAVVLDRCEVGAEDVAGMQADEVLGHLAVEGRVLAVRVTAMLVAVEVRDHDRRVVLYEAQFRHPPLEREFGVLAVGDVRVGADDAHRVAAGIALGHGAVAQDPLPLARVRPDAVLGDVLGRVSLQRCGVAREQISALVGVRRLEHRGERRLRFRWRHVHQGRPALGQVKASGCNVMVPVREAAAVQRARELFTGFAFLREAAFAIGEVRRQLRVGAGQLVDARQQARGRRNPRRIGFDRIGVRGQWRRERDPRT